MAPSCLAQCHWVFVAFCGQRRGYEDGLGRPNPVTPPILGLDTYSYMLFWSQVLLPLASKSSEAEYNATVHWSITFYLSFPVYGAVALPFFVDPIGSRAFSRSAVPRKTAY